MNKKKLIACLTGIALFAGTLTGCADEKEQKQQNRSH